MSFSIGNKVVYQRRDIKYLATIFDTHVTNDTTWYDLRFDIPHDFARAISDGISDTINDGDEKRYYSVREEKLTLSRNTPVYETYVTTLSGKICPKEFVATVLTNTATIYLSYADKRNYVPCESCGEYHERSALRTVYGYDGNGYNRTAHYFCNDCVGSNSRECVDCLELFLTRNINSNDRCPTCARRARNRIRYYHDSHCNGYTFNGNTRNNTFPYLGFELEVESTEGDWDKRIDCAYNVHQIMGDEFISTEEDGSLDCGFETITQPATYQYHRSIEDKYRTLMENYVEYGMSGTVRCGLHVHFNRNFFTSEDHLVNLFRIFDKFWDNIVNFSRRDGASLNHWAKKPCTDVEQAIEDNDRYCAINLTNDNTIEFRVFASTTDCDTLMNVLEFVYNVVMTAKYSTTEQINNLVWEDFFDTNRVDRLALTA